MYMQESIKFSLTSGMIQSLHDIDTSPDSHVLRNNYNLSTVKALLRRELVTLIVHHKHGPRVGPLIRRRRGNECMNANIIYRVGR